MTGSAHSPFRWRFVVFDYGLGFSTLLIQSTMATGTEPGSQDEEHYCLMQQNHMEAEAL